jgi:hypothetical protein
MHRWSCARRKDIFENDYLQFLGLHPQNARDGTKNFGVMMKSHIKFFFYTVVFLLVPFAAIAQGAAQSVVPSAFLHPASSVSEQYGTAKDFIGKVAKIGDWETPFNGLYPLNFLGLFESRTSGKMYDLQTYSIKNNKSPLVLILSEVAWKNPSDHGYGYNNVVFNDAVDLKYKGEKPIHMDIGSCIPELGDAHLWSPSYVIVTMMRDINKKHPKNDHEKWLVNKGFQEGFAEGAWFVDTDNGKLIPLTESEMNLLICRVRSSY